METHVKKSSICVFIVLCLVITHFSCYLLGQAVANTKYIERDAQRVHDSADQLEELHRRRQGLDR